MTRISIPSFPTPPAGYDSQDESQFRRMLESWMREVVFAIETATESPTVSNPSGAAALVHKRFTIAASGSTDITGTAALSYNAFTMTAAGGVPPSGAVDLIRIEGNP